MPVLERETNMEQLMENAEIEEVLRRTQAFKVPKGRKIRVLITIPEEKAEKETPKVSKWRNFLQEAETVDLSDDTFEHMQTCSKEFRESFAFKQDLT